MTTNNRFCEVCEKSRFLTGNMIKILAAIFMVIDHIGVVFGMEDGILRILGRISMPLFAFMISEGAKYTRNKAKYLGMIAGMATVCQLVYFFVLKDTYMCILVTFSISITLIYCVDFIKWSFLSEKRNIVWQILSSTLFLCLVALTYYLNTVIMIDYGFYGIMMPVFASLTDLRGYKIPDKVKWIDSIWFRSLLMTIPMLVRMLNYPPLMWYSFISISILMLYSGKRGKLKMKYFFYIFYPLHLVIIYVIFLAIYILKML